MAVKPSLRGQGIGRLLQSKRLAAMKSLGCEKVITNADRPETIAWYKKHFHYRQCGTLTKKHSFGIPEINEWTTLECDLDKLDFSDFIPPPPQRALIINAALTGTVHSPDASPHLPVTPKEIAADARKAVDAGAAIVHLHARDSAGNPTLSPDRYSEIMKRVRSACPEAVLCISTSGRLEKSTEGRLAVLSLTGDCKPDMASLTIGSLNFPTQASVNDPHTIKQLANRMKEACIKPEIEVFDLGMLDYSRYLIRKGYLEMPLYINVLLGSLGTLAARKNNAEIMRQALPIDTCCSFAGIGRYQERMTRWAVSNGVHVRVGLEDNLFTWKRNDRELTTNQAKVKEVRKLAEQAGRRIASPSEARAMLGLS